MKKTLNRLGRFSGASWFEDVQNQTIMVAGVGGIGSWTAVLLSRLNPKCIILVDPDTVEENNLAGQMFTKSNIMLNKVTAVATHIINFSDYTNVIQIEESYREDSLTYDIMICGFDNMVARKTYYNNWKKHVSLSDHPEKCLFIDGRLAAEKFQVLTITGNSPKLMQKYEDEFLFSDAEADEVLCSFKQTSHCAAIISGIIVNCFINFICNLKDEERSLPFFITYNSSQLNLS